MSRSRNNGVGERKALTVAGAGALFAVALVAVLYSALGSLRPTRDSCFCEHEHAIRDGGADAQRVVSNRATGDVEFLHGTRGVQPPTETPWTGG